MEPLNQFDSPVHAGPLDPTKQRDLDREYNLERNPFMQAYTALQIAYIAVPIISGIDKFTYFLTDWTQYIAPIFPEAFNLNSVNFLYVVGILETIAGIGVAFKPRFFGYFLMAWSCVVILNLFIMGKFFEVALLHFGLALGAYTLARLTEAKIKDYGLNEDETYTAPIIH